MKVKKELQKKRKGTKKNQACNSLGSFLMVCLLGTLAIVFAVGSKVAGFIEQDQVYAAAEKKIP